MLNLGLSVKIGFAGYGVVGFLKGGKEGKNIAWRAEMGALQNDFSDEVSYKSKNKGIHTFAAMSIWQSGLE
ncbi:amidohydrolase [Yeosuana marina]|uniref:amidohydrolase n=1 Tax=Yeosuana marina TaxID=1565536 RepID=UPI001423EC7F|nr:amidohydrolase [Yeosuana marina]